MELFYFKDKNELDTLTSGADFLQSWTWGRIVRQDGYQIKRLGWRQEAPTAALAETVAAVTLIKEPLGVGRFYWYTPRGPLLEAASPDEAKEIFQSLAKDIKALDTKALFWRLEPDVYRFVDQDAVSAPVDLWSEIIKAANSAAAESTTFKLIKTNDVQPSQTLFLDLSLSEAELLAQMRQKTRYNLRLAQKKGVKIEEGSVKDIDEFWRLLSLTGRRDRFRLHNFKHYQNLLATGAPQVKLLLASYQNETIAAGLFSLGKLKTTYLHGASDNKHRNVMAPYLLQWEAIRRAKDNGSSYYDFYGVDEQKWPGVSRFKLGFGGRRVIYPGTYDLVLRPGAYWLYKWLRRLRRFF